MKGIEYRICGEGEEILVFENGLGNSMYGWEFVKERLKNRFKLFFYHRKGYGESDDIEGDIDTEVIIDNLEALLRSAGIREKIILIGHSFGGLCVQHFARKYPERVKGVVLVDSTSENFQELEELKLPFFQKNINNKIFIEQWNEIAKKDSNDFQKNINVQLSEKEKLMEEEIQKKAIKFGKSQRLYYTCAKEMSSWEKSSIKIKKSGKFPDVPLMVIARDKRVSADDYISKGVPEREAYTYEETWRRLIEEQCELRDKSELIIAHGCDHVIQMDNPQYIIEGISRLMSQL